MNCSFDKEKIIKIVGITILAFLLFNMIGYFFAGLFIVGGAYFVYKKVDADFLEGSVEHNSENEINDSQADSSDKIKELTEQLNQARDYFKK